MAQSSMGAGRWLQRHSCFWREIWCYYSSYDHHRIQRLSSWVNATGLIDLGFVGPAYTWFRKGQGCVRLKERIRDLLTQSLFPEAVITLLPLTYSDHRPLLLVTKQTHSNSNQQKSFRFQKSRFVYPLFSTKNDSLPAQELKRKSFPQKELK